MRGRSRVYKTLTSTGQVLKTQKDRVSADRGQAQLRRSLMNCKATPNPSGAMPWPVPGIT